MSNPWFRLYAEAVDDDKLRLLAFEDRWHYIAILCCKGHGILDDGKPFMLRRVAVKLEVSLSELAGIANRLHNAGLIDYQTLQPITIKTERPPLSIWKTIRDAIFKRDDYTCRYCGARGVRLECDHVLPFSRGGDNSEENLVTACLPCNRAKRDKTPEEWLVDGFNYANRGGLNG